MQWDLASALNVECWKQEFSLMILPAIKLHFVCSEHFPASHVWLLEGDFLYLCGLCAHGAVLFYRTIGFKLRNIGDMIWKPSHTMTGCSKLQLGDIQTMPAQHAGLAHGFVLGSIPTVEDHFISTNVLFCVWMGWKREPAVKPPKVELHLKRLDAVVACFRNTLRSANSARENLLPFPSCTLFNG